jgi:integrase
VGINVENEVIRGIHRLSPAGVKNAKPGMHPDGAGLYLQVTQGKSGLNKSWVFRWAEDGRDRYMGLGPLHTVTLAEAREKAREARLLRLDGVDPIEHRNAQRNAARLERAKAMSFDECRDRYIAAHQSGWRSVKHASEWRTTLSAYVSPVFGKLPVQSIDVALVMTALEPTWTKIPDTANRIRVRIERILNWATVRGYRQGENPARWRGHLDHLLPRVSKVRAAGHHAALPYAEISTFMAELKCRDGVTPRALEFAILTAARSGEVLGARWDEIDLDAGLWTIPAERMKAGREHRVPLSKAACDVLKRMAKVRENNLVFPGTRRAHIGNMAFHNMFQRMGREALTVHGFRSTFRDWVAEKTNFPGDAAELALAHKVRDKTEAAYRRGDMLDKRRPLMEAWAEYCGKTA